jgi:hypothetical protein
MTVHEELWEPHFVKVDVGERAEHSLIYEAVDLWIRVSNCSPGFVRPSTEAL